MRNEDKIKTSLISRQNKCRSVFTDHLTSTLSELNWLHGGRHEYLSTHEKCLNTAVELCNNQHGGGGTTSTANNCLPACH